MRWIGLAVLLMGCTPPVAKDSYTHVAGMSAMPDGSGVLFYDVLVKANAEARELDGVLRGHTNGPVTDDMDDISTVTSIGLASGMGDYVDDRSEADSSQSKAELELDLNMCDGAGYTVTEDGGCEVSALISSSAAFARGGMIVTASIRGFAPEGWDGDPDAPSFELTMDDVTAEWVQLLTAAQE